MASVKVPAKADTAWFVHDRLGMFIHWGTYSLAARHEWVKKKEKIPTAEYMKYFNHFNPDLYNPTEWARMAKNAGMKYFVITAKHHEGFCLWDTKHTQYKATKTPYAKDVLKPMVDAFRAEGLHVGLYYSLIDWHHPEFTVDSKHPMREDKKERAKNSKRDMKKYAQYMRDQVTELLTQFGKIDIVWFDFSYPGKDGKGRNDWESKKLVALVRKLQPGIMIDNRLNLPGAPDFITPEQFQPLAPVTDDKGKPAIWEACQTFSGSWGYHRDEQTWKSTSLLIRMLVDGVSKGGNLLLNVGPTARGEFDYRAKERLEGMGKWMHYHSASIYGCGPAPKDISAPVDCRYTYNAAKKRLYLHVFAWPFKAVWCPGLKSDRVEYAQFMHDASEVKFAPLPEAGWPSAGSTEDMKNACAFHFPAIKPPIEIPVIEIFLKK